MLIKHLYLKIGRRDLCRKIGGSASSLDVKLVCLWPDYDVWPKWKRDNLVLLSIDIWWACSRNVKAMKSGMMVIMMVMLGQSLHRSKTSFKDRHLNNTLVTVDRGQDLTLNCRIARKQVGIGRDKPVRKLSSITSAGFPKFWTLPPCASNLLM